MKSEKNDIWHNNPDLKKNPFRVPEEYFQHFPSRIMDRIKEEEVKNRIIKRDRRIRFRNQLAIAATLLGAALGSFSLVKNLLVKSPVQEDFVDLELLEETNTIPEDAYLVDVYTMGSESTSEELWEDEAINYLASNDIEIELLMEQY
jgi:hypothetical protein